MRKLGLLATVALGFAGSAHAADMAPTACASFNDFFTTNCPMTWNGIQVYGTIDMGVAYQTHGVPFNRNLATGIEELVSKNSNRARWNFAPNGLSQSVVGIRGDEEFAPGWSFVFDGETGFDPYSLQLANSLKALEQNNGIAAKNQTANADSSRAGQWDNSQGYVGVKSAEFGTLVVGRVNSLFLDGINSYDPMGGSYAFSPIGYSGTAAGTGYTEDTRANTAAKYRVSVGPFRAAALVQEGGYELGNAATSAYQFQVGGDVPTGGYGKASLDAIYSKEINAVAASALSAAQQALHPGTLDATISNNTGVMLLAKYSYGPATISGGYEHLLFQNPSNPQASFSSIGGYPISTVTNNAYTANKTLQIFWIGAKYAVTDKLDVTGAYYHYLQSNYNATSCSNTSSSHCQGTLDAMSIDVDYRILPKLDAYAGVMFSAVNGGLANGYIYRVSADPMAGVRFKF